MNWKYRMPQETVTYLIGIISVFAKKSAKLSWAHTGCADRKCATNSLKRGTRCATDERVEKRPSLIIRKKSLCNSCCSVFRCTQNEDGKGDWLQLKFFIPVFHNTACYLGELEWLLGELVDPWKALMLTITPSALVDGNASPAETYDQGRRCKRRAGVTAMSWAGLVACIGGSVVFKPLWGRSSLGNQN